MNQLCIFVSSFFARTSPDILIKHNVKETGVKGNISGEFQITEVKVSCGSQRRG